jgi:hypothetical protein
MPAPSPKKGSDELFDYLSGNGKNDLTLFSLFSCQPISMPPSAISAVPVV